MLSIRYTRQDVTVHYRLKLYIKELSKCVSIKAKNLNEFVYEKKKKTENK